MSRINSKIEELARLKYTRQASDISARHHREIQRLGDPRQSGAVKAAIDKELVEMARECAAAKAEIWLDMFRQEGFPPTPDDFNQVFSEIEQSVNHIQGQHRGGVVPLESYRSLLARIRRDLQIAIKELELSRVTPEQAAGGNTYNLNVNQNYGGIQQGGVGNTQNVTINAEFQTNVSELLTLVENSSLTQVQKLKVVNDIRAVEDLSKMEASPEVVDEAGRRLDGVTSVISLSADLVSLGMPIVMILRAFFGI